MMTLITTEFLELEGFAPHPKRRCGLSREWDDGNLLQLIPDVDGGWIVELWNKVDDSQSRASFPCPIRYEQELRVLINLMTPIPF